MITRILIGEQDKIVEMATYLLEQGVTIPPSLLGFPGESWRQALWPAHVNTGRIFINPEIGNVESLKHWVNEVAVRDDDYLTYGDPSQGRE